MEYTLFALMILSGISFGSAITQLKKQNKSLKERLNKLAEITGHPEISTNYISDNLKNQLISLCKENKDVQAVKLLRQNTQMDLLEAKQYVDNLSEKQACI